MLGLSATRALTGSAEAIDLRENLKFREGEK